MPSFRWAASLVLIPALLLSPARSSYAGFIYSPLSGTITAAEFRADFAGLTAHRFYGNTPLNEVILFDPYNSLRTVDLSDQLFGTADVLAGSGSLEIDLADNQTQLFSAAIPDTFFTVLATGRVGLSFQITDTGDGAFAMDFLSLDITTTTGSYRAFIDRNDGYGIGIGDNNLLPGSLFDVLPTGTDPTGTGTGFDEIISSKSDYNNPIPEPGTALLAGAGALLLPFVRRRNRRHD